MFLREQGSDWCRCYLPELNLKPGSGVQVGCWRWCDNKVYYRGLSGCRNLLLVGYEKVRMLPLVARDMREAAMLESGRSLPWMLDDPGNKA